MIPYKYTYLILATLFSLIWIILYLIRKDNRKEMFYVSLIFALPGILTDVIYTLDWWKPETITNSTLGIESILAGFFIGGIASVLYEDIFKKKIKPRKRKKIETKQSILDIMLIIILGTLLFFGTFLILKNSLIATIIGLIVPIIIILIQRRDLIIDALASGVLFLLIAMIIYTLLEWITPGWVERFWYFKNIPDILILNMPLDDIIWYFLAGTFIGPLYEYYKEAKIVNTN